MSECHRDGSIDNLKEAHKSESDYVIGSKLGSRLRGNNKSPLFTRVSDPVQECPFYARRVPLNASQFSKKRQLRRFF